MKILVVDDSMMDRRLTMSLLKKNGVENEIIQAEDGEKGLELLSLHYQDICLVLLDWQMPNVDGIAFMKAAQSVSQVSDIPIVMITASGSDENKRLANETNPKLAGYVVKPYKADDLLEVIKPLIK